MKNGFTLVVTLMLMILLTVIGVGMLTWATITLRASSQGEALAVARANARLSLMLAIGELQKTVGSDMRITAPSEIVTTSALSKPRLIGVWKSWNYKPNEPNLDYAKPREAGFIGWLASDKNIRDTLVRDYVIKEHSGETIQLVGPRSLGVTQANPVDVVKVGKVPLFRDGRDMGAYAWHVSDESVKARINAYRDPSQTLTLAHKRALLTGHRPSTSFIKSADGASLSFKPSDENPAKFKDATDVSKKLLTAGQVELLDGSRNLARFRNHVTLHSTGLLVNVREGGLKQDLSSVFGYRTSSMPGEFNWNQLYASTHRISGISDPYWSALKSYYDVYLEPSINSDSPVYAKAPVEDVSLSAPPVLPMNYYAAPVIVKVELLFSFVVREAHGGWRNRGPGLTRMGHLLYAPIITLHNPYNISLRFDKLDIDIKGVPMAFNFIINDLRQNDAPVSFNEMFVYGEDRREKSFLLSISNWSDTTSNSPSPITMKPGQTLVCGPYINGDAVFGPNGEGQSDFFDWNSNLTGTTYARAKCKPGYLGRQVSYDIDWLTLPEHMENSTDGNLGTLIIKPEDRIYIEWKVKPNTGNITNKMTASARLTSQGMEKEMGGLEFDYDDAALTKEFPVTGRYPDVKSFPNHIIAESIYEPNDKPIKNQTLVKSFAMLSAYARTINGGVYDHGSRDPLPAGLNHQYDGKLAGRPFLHHNAAVNPCVINLARDLPGLYSHELNVQPLPGNVDDIFNIDSGNRGYALTSNKTARGVKSGSYLELPTGPMQTIADFRRSNALTSALLPFFVQPVANSYASPLIATDSVSQSGVAAYPLLDHSVLANHALYDRFYFSALAGFNGRNADVVFKEFMTGASPLLTQAYEPHLPEGKTLEKAQASLFSGSLPVRNAYQNVSQYQLIRGAFNVNSTDVQAWKALLSSMGNSLVQTLWTTTGTLSEKNATIPILPMSLVNGGAVGDVVDKTRTDNQRTNDLNGYRNLTPAQLDLLAAKIVEEVRKRGPFLSLSEFVNRRIGPESELTTVGALQAAIDKSKINEDLLKGYVTDVRPVDVGNPRIYKFANPNAECGNPAAGAPGWIMQGDLMRILEPVATVRGDTFVIRVCGESHDPKGRVMARAYAEALVQRFPDYVNRLNTPSTNVWSPSVTNAKPDNIAFGRCLKVVSFRWLTESEI